MVRGFYGAQEGGRHNPIDVQGGHPLAQLLRLLLPIVGEPRIVGPVGRGGPLRVGEILAVGMAGEPEGLHGNGGNAFERNTN